MVKKGTRSVGRPRPRCEQLRRKSLYREGRKKRGGS
jgi:hypothetical protein